MHQQNSANYYDFPRHPYCINRNRNHTLEISKAPSKAKLWESAYSQALNQNKIDRQEVKIKRVRQTDGYGGWCLELRRGESYGEEDEPG